MVEDPDMTVEEYVHALGEATGHGWGFLAGYGLTWLGCAVAWRRSSPRVAAWCTLIQGLVALPVALALTTLTGGPARPSMAGMDGLSILLASSQLLGLPVVIGFLARGFLTLVPLGMVLLLVVHFAPYSWLYDTWLYVVMGGLLSVVASVGAVGIRKPAAESDEPGTIGAGRVCLTTGLIMLVCAPIAWSL